jgi:hypothetical protein
MLEITEPFDTLCLKPPLKTNGYEMTENQHF